MATNGLPPVLVELLKQAQQITVLGETKLSNTLSTDVEQTATLDSEGKLLVPLQDLSNLATTEAVEASLKATNDLLDEVLTSVGLNADGTFPSLEETAYIDDAKTTLEALLALDLAISYLTGKGDTDIGSLRVELEGKIATAITGVEDLITALETKVDDNKEELQGEIDRLDDAIQAHTSGASTDIDNILTTGSDGRPFLSIDAIESEIESAVEAEVTNALPGITPNVRSGVWYVGDTSTGLNAQGPKGEDGRNMEIDVTFASIALMNAALALHEYGTWAMIDTGSVEDVDTGKLYFRDTSEWRFIVDLSGMQGVRGESAFEAFQRLNPGFDGTEEEWLESMAIAIEPVRQTSLSRGSELAANSLFNVPNYVVGSDTLQVYLMGVLCNKTVTYEEVGDSGELSTMIRWLAAIPMDIAIDVVSFHKD